MEKSFRYRRDMLLENEEKSGVNEIYDIKDANCTWQMLVLRFTDYDFIPATALRIAK